MSAVPAYNLALALHSQRMAAKRVAFAAFRSRAQGRLWAVNRLAASAQLSYSQAMSKPTKHKLFAGLSTGVMLEQYARSILKQVSSIGENPHATGNRREPVHIGVEPMLLALAMEFALKAWFVWDHDRHNPIRTHNLAKLFDALPASSRERLDIAFKRKVAPNLSWYPSMAYSIRDVLDHHANAFVEWRYLHEDRDGGLNFDFTTFVSTLEIVLDEFGKRYETREVRPQRTLD